MAPEVSFGQNNCPHNYFMRTFRQAQHLNTSRGAAYTLLLSSGTPCVIKGSNSCFFCLPQRPRAEDSQCIRTDGSVPFVRRPSSPMAQLHFTFKYSWYRNNVCPPLPPSSSIRVIFHPVRTHSSLYINNFFFHQERNPEAGQRAEH